MKTLTTPELQPSIDKADIIQWDADPAKRTLRLLIAKGYEADGALVIKSTLAVSISGDAYDTIFDTLGEVDKSIKSLLLEKVWAYLNAQHIVETV